MRGTIVPGAVAADDPIRGTVAPDGLGAPPRAITTSGPIEPPTSRHASSQKPDIRGTMVINQTPGGDDEPVAVPEKRIATLPQNEAGEQTRRLEYLCQLIRRARQPLCPINGILALLPFGIIQSGMGGAREVQRALKADLKAVRRSLQLRCPVTMMVVGMENESGFRELVRRVGRERAAAQRFGKGFDKDQVWNELTPERLEATCAHACGAFEDWVYALFKERGALSKEVGNKKLFALLCKVRRDLKDRLSNLLIAAHDLDQEQDQEKDTWLFGGNYFSATGDREDRQAFVAGVFEKLPEQQEEVEWTREALQRDRFYRLLGYYAIAFDIALAVGLAVFTFWDRIFPKQ
jgi:type VI protein secretion system component VasK